MDKEEIVNKILKDDELPKTVDGNQVPEKEKVETYFKTFKNVKGQLYNEIERLRKEAYDQAYEEAKNDPDYIIKIKEIEQDEKDYANGERRQHPHGDLRRQKAENDIKKKAQEAEKKAIPKDPLGVALMLKKSIRFIRIQPATKNQRAPLYFYNPDKGYYLEDNELMKDLISLINPVFSERQAEDVLYKIGRKSPLRTNQNEFTAFGNCLYNHRTNQFSEFNPTVAVIRKIDTNYNPNAQQPNINGWTPEGWLLELFDQDEESYQLALQMIRACVTGLPLKKIFWLYGEGGTGKGTLQQLIINLVGLDNVASLKITGLEKSRFTTSILLGKSVVIGDDVQKDAIIKDTSELFSLTTEDLLTIEEKGKKPYSLNLQMTVIQSSNGFPRMDGDKGAIDRRFRVLPFTNAFKGKPNKAIREDYIKRKEVLEYLLKLAIETPVMDINPKASRELLHQFQQDMNPVISFVDEFFTDELESEFLPNYFIWWLWGEYLEYYKHHSSLKVNALHREIRKHLPSTFVVHSKMTPAGRELPLGFQPKDDIPGWANHNLFKSGRTRPEQQRKPRLERGYLKIKRE
ncbi:DNA primase family protein [Streptococcus merionis]|uniref:Phage/plasmid primase, P4 family, C-terminal domain protein n=1 Tax=Streptococcus merionis TaxID=400065 RepID=A0A239SYL2_9STRE|nr:DNA primase family protein [Streptococcus merionis]QBX08766.1 DNA primase [Streptococcus satellite phage Javan294]SNU90605.1 phage/plasmid primase, P4 family, C-terminal domain protein [Streptococcus merionis]